MFLSFLPLQGEGGDRDYLHSRKYFERLRNNRSPEVLLVIVRLNKLIILNLTGEMVLSKQGGYSGETEVTLGNIKYIIKISEPDWPG